MPHSASLASNRSWALNRHEPFDPFRIATVPGTPCARCMAMSGTASQQGREQTNGRCGGSDYVAAAVAVCEFLADLPPTNCSLDPIVIA